MTKETMDLVTLALAVLGPLELLEPRASGAVFRALSALEDEQLARQRNGSAVGQINDAAAAALG